MSLDSLSAFRPQTTNLNKHTQRGMGELETSIQQDGWIGAITVAADGETFDGSARLEVAAATGFGDAIVIESDGSQPVVVKRTDIPTAKDKRAVRLGIAANRVPELNLDWDAELFKELALNQFDFGGLMNNMEIAEIIGEPPTFDPVGADQQGRLDATACVTCPECGHEFTP